MRLTLMARQRVRQYSREDLTILLHDVLNALSRETQARPTHRLEDMARNMEHLTGIDIRDRRGRNASAVRARSIFCYVARREGFSSDTLAEFMGCHRSRVYYGETRMTDALAFPKAYEDYINLYNRFVETL